ncbi:MAG: histidine phosphatase family protein, partial [Chloroflexi bacterium]|nr:histidine phosphatase family protein [Chloroflexota bacterium]
MGLGESLRKVKLSAIYSSPLKRALVTAEAIARHHGLPVLVEPALREMEVGDLEGLSLVELGKNFSQFLVEWRNGEGAGELPGGESLVDLANRVWPVVQGMLNNNKQGDIAVVSHYFVTVT